MKKVLIAIIIVAIVLVVSVTPAFATAQYSSSTYSSPKYGTQWNYSRTPSKIVTLQNGMVKKWSPSFQINNIGSVPFTKAIMTIKVTRVEISEQWLSDPSDLALVQVQNSNGIFTFANGSTGYVLDLGTIDPGSYSQHVLNMKYDSSVTSFTFNFNVWYIP